jgi:hypothetical protein
MLVGALSVFGGAAAASTGATIDEAVAMVKKSVAHSRTEGPEKVYAAISGPSRQYVDRDLYVVVYGLDGVVLAHGAGRQTHWHQPRSPTRIRTARIS